MRTPIVSILTLCALGAAAPLAAHPDHAAPAQAPEEIVQAFHRALAGGDQKGALALLAPEVVIFESGGAELSRGEYAHHHLGADMEFSAAVESRTVDRRHGGGGETAWVISRTEAKGSFRGRAVHSRGTETMILEQAADGWKIVHIHWSSQAVKKD